MKQRAVLDMTDHETYGFGARSPTWWGTLAFCALEGMGFALAVGAYLYLAFLSPNEWPLASFPPDHWPATILTAILLASAIPNAMVKDAAKTLDIGKVQILLLVLSAVGLVALILRAFEFPALGIAWDTNAYGSALWLILGLHTAHIATDVVDTFVLTALMFTRHGKNGRRFTDVEDNAFYWYFVILSWLPLYVLIYWAPRW
jgi:cytochrome c oxidase subunit III